MEADPDRVLDLLPQREPRRMVDRVEVLEPGARIEATHHVPADATYFRGHFPGDPVVPGVVQIEALVQAAGLLILADAPNPDGLQLLMMGLDRVRFRRRVDPGDELRLVLTVVSRRGPVWKLDGVTSVGGETATQARLLLNAAASDVR